ncbi:MAG: hypothetical protein LWY06_09265 [Firmicutes bacterium]|nr:hypothetical protein [Bacillota bacterium]
MKSFSVYYVKTHSIEKVQAYFKPVEAMPDSDWLVCGYKPGAYAPDDSILLGEESLTEEKSKQFGDIIYLYASFPDSFVYEHSRDGELLRKLVWYPMLDDEWNPGWLCVRGEREEWEDQFFREANLNLALEHERDKFEELDIMDSFPEREEEIRRLWAEKRIKEQDVIPTGDAGFAFTVEKFFGLKRPEST